MRMSLICDGSYVVPRNGPGMTKYPYVIPFFDCLQRPTRCNRNSLGPNQVCTLFGAQAGSDVVIGDNYLEARYGITAADIWRRNFVMIVGFLIFFLFTQVVAIEFFSVRLFNVRGESNLLTAITATICSLKSSKVRYIFTPRKTMKRWRSTKFSARRRPDAMRSLMQITAGPRGSHVMKKSSCPWCGEPLRCALISML